jgi:nitrogen fixation protein NifU and related proteins
MATEDLYNRLLISHYRSADHRYIPDSYTHTATGHNPVCGDEVTLYLDIDGEPAVIREAAFEGKGCMICLASASMLAGAIGNKTVAEARKAIGHLESIMGGAVEPTGDDPDYAALSVIREYPMRQKCAMLAWETARGVLDRL